jgi:hypothetical protein
MTTPDALSSPLNLDFPSLDEITLAGDSLDSIQSIQIITTLPVGKPSKSSFFRTHPEPAYWVTVGILELEETREIFLVMPGAMVHAMGMAKPAQLVPFISLTGHLGIWPIKLGANSWNESARDAAVRAKDSWLRLASGQGSYDLFVAQADLPEPTWPNLTPADFIKAGFKHRVIRDATHEVVRKLAGESV